MSDNSSYLCIILQTAVISASTPYRKQAQDFVVFLDQDPYKQNLNSHLIQGMVSVNLTTSTSTLVFCNSLQDLGQITQRLEEVSRCSKIMVTKPGITWGN